MVTSNNTLMKPTADMLGVEVAPAGSDWAFFSRLSAMPNPDPILRRIGRSATVYASIMADAHVMGDIRSIRGSFRSLDYRVVAGDEQDERAKAARDLCVWWLEHLAPNTVAVDWQEVMWQMCSAIFTGYKIHEVVWNYVGDKLLPVAVKDRANSRFSFDANGNILLLSAEHPQGAAVAAYQFVASRHMADCDNPYGKALLSSCFWPWTFKTGGFKYFVQYCERHGLPWPFARYPQGATAAEIASLERAVAGMLNNGFIVAPVGAELDLINSGSVGAALPQENLINLCNREMSKALTGQAMVAESQKTGARAASETAAERSEGIHDSDRDIAAASFGTIFRWITTFNFGADVAAPQLEFFKRKSATKERAESYAIAASLGARPSKRSLLEELNIPAADDEADAIVATGAAASASAGASAVAQFAAAFDALDSETALSLAASAAYDGEFEAAVIQPFADMLDALIAAGGDLNDFKDALGGLLQGVDAAELLRITNQALTLSALHGAVEHQVRT